MAKRIWFSCYMSGVLWLLLVVGLAAVPVASQSSIIPVLIVDGQNNHNWRETTPLLKGYLESSGLFRVVVATLTPKDAQSNTSTPRFSDYRTVVLNYTDLGNGVEWPEQMKKSFVEYVRSGGGVVVFHAASSAFPDWPEFNQITGLGGWGGRNERSGPYVYFKNGKEVRDPSPGPAGHHGQRHEFRVKIVNKDHPVTSGLPDSWMHAKDELYDSLRGPALNMTILATAYSDPATGGTGRDEPVLWTVRFGKGRIFHTTLGHDATAMNDPGFIVTLQRGTEWAATGQVTQAVPANFAANAQAPPAPAQQMRASQASAGAGAAGAAEGKTLFQQKCGFCHGMDGSGGQGADLLHSELVLRDDAGSMIGPVVRQGRVDKGMPSFHLTDSDIQQIAAFLHAQIKAAATIFYTDSTSGYPAERLLVGDAQAGKNYFEGEGKCVDCHSASGDLAHVASKYKPFDLQTRMLNPTGPSPTLTVTSADGRTWTGQQLRLDSFFVSLRDADGWTHSWSRGAVEVKVSDPLAAHREKVPQYTDEQIHNLFAYLETLK